MPKLPRLTAKEAERILFNAGFTLMRTQGSHRIYFKNDIRVIIPFHSGKILHPKIIKQIISVIEQSNNN